jgi:hypothetical protein
MASAVHVQERQDEYMFKVLFNSIQEFTLKKHLHLGLDKINGSLIHHTDAPADPGSDSVPKQVD